MRRARRSSRAWLIAPPATAAGSVAVGGLLRRSGSGGTIGTGGKAGRDQQRRPQAIELHMHLHGVSPAGMARARTQCGVGARRPASGKCDVERKKPPERRFMVLRKMRTTG